MQAVNTPSMTTIDPVMDNVDGFIFEHHKNGIDFAVRYGDQRVERGQLVTSNGRCNFLIGRRGIVVNIHRPYKNCRTSNIIEVHFEGCHYSHDMKFKDLNL